MGYTFFRIQVLQSAYQIDFFYYNQDKSELLILLQQCQFDCEEKGDKLQKLMKDNAKLKYSWLENNSKEIPGRQVGIITYFQNQLPERRDDGNFMKTI